MMNADLLDRIQSSARIFTMDAVMDKITAIQKAQKDIAANANLRLTVETMILRLSRTENTETGSGRVVAAGRLQ